MKKRINEYTVKNQTLNSDKKIVNISDIHSAAKTLDEITIMLDSINPDILTISGDVIDCVDAANMKKMYYRVLNLCLKYKTYISLGNHDTVKFVKENGKRKEVDTRNYDFFKELSKEGANVIYNTTDCLQASDDINIYAVNPSVAWYQNGENKEEFAKIMERYNFDQDKFNLLLSHSGNGFLNNNELICDPNIDLILSGHNHGGLTSQFLQDHLKSHRGLVGPYGKFFFKHAYGYYTNEDSALIMSNGVTKVANSNEISPMATAINNVFIPDIDVINLKAADSNEVTLDRKYILK